MQTGIVIDNNPIFDLKKEKKFSHKYNTALIKQISLFDTALKSWQIPKVSIQYRDKVKIPPPPIVLRSSLPQYHYG